MYRLDMIIFTLVLAVVRILSLFSWILFGQISSEFNKLFVRLI